MGNHSAVTGIWKGNKWVINQIIIILESNTELKTESFTSKKTALSSDLMRY